MLFSPGRTVAPALFALCMKIIIRYFGPVRELLEKEEEEMDVAEPFTVADLRREIAGRVPASETLLRSCRFAVDMRYAAENQEIPSGGEVAIIPPVAGG